MGNSSAHLLVPGSMVELCEERPEQALAGLPAAEGVRVVRQQEHQLRICLPLHLRSSSRGTSDPRLAEPSQMVCLCTLIALTAAWTS